MAHPKAMGIGAMFVLLIIAVVLLPMIVRYIDKMEPHYVISGFQNKEASSGMAVRVPAGAAGMAPTYHPDANTDYLCRSPNGSDKPCPEGTFCDGLTQSCVPVYPGGAVPETGYFA